MLSSCSNDKTDEGGQSIAISCGEIINANPSGEQTTVTVTSTGAWRLAGVSDWVHPSAVKGQNGDQITLTIDANNSDESREATLKFFTGSAIAAVKVISVQGDILQLISKPEMLCTRKAQDVFMNVKTNLETLTYAFSDGGEQWVSFAERADAFGMTTLTFKVLANEGFDDRTSVVTISGEGVPPVQVTLTQQQTDVIKIEQTLYTLPLEAGKLVVNLQTNVKDYLVEIPTKSQSWIHRDVVPQGRGVVDKSESFTIDAAEGLRSGKITFKSPDGAVSVTIKIVQQGDKHFYATIPDAKFRKYLFDSEFAVELANETEKIELTMDGVNATELTFPRSGGIVSIEGIDVFKKLTRLDCNGNKILNIELGSLPVTVVSIRESSLSGDLVISGEYIEDIDAYYIYGLKTFDVSGCPKLATLNIEECYFMTTLYLKTGVAPAIKDEYAGYYAPGRTYQKVYK